MEIILVEDVLYCFLFECVGVCGVLVCLGVVWCEVVGCVDYLLLLCDLFG